MKFLEFVTRDLYERFGGELYRVTVVLPTRRAGVFVKDYLAELSADVPMWTPQCTTISDFFDSLCPLKPTDEIQAVCELYKICGKGLSLDAFYGWGRQLITDFNNIDRSFNGMPVDNILRNAMEAHNFDVSLVDAEVKSRIEGLMRGQHAESRAESDSIRKAYQVIWEQLPEIYRKLSERLALSGAREKWVIEHFDEVWQQLSGRVFAFVGFNMLLPVERLLMEKLKERGAALIYWDYDEQFDDEEPYIKVYNNVRKNIWKDGNRTHVNLGGEYEKTESTKMNVELLAASSDSAQARYVYDWLLANHHEGEKTAVVICDERQLEHVVHSLPAQFADAVNITKGFPMRNTTIYAEIAEWLGNNKSEQDFSGTMQRLLDFIDSHAIVVDSDEGSTLGDMPWQKLLNAESVYQARLVVVRFLQLLADGTLVAVTKFATLRNLLMRHLSTVSIPFHGEPITDIQIIGVLETRALDFDNILFLNVEEGVVPRMSKDNSFIPYYLRKYYGLPTNDEQTEIYAYNFFRLLRRAKRVTMMYSDAQTAEGQKTMSRFAMQMMASERFKIECFRLADRSALPAQPTDEEKVKRLQSLTQWNNYKEKLNAARAANPNLLLKGSMFNAPSLSPSAINSFMTCRMKFFIRYLLDIPEPESTDNLLQNNEIGTLIHHSVQNAYEEIIGNPKRPQTPQAIKAFLANPLAMERAIMAACKKNKVDPATHPAELAVVRTHVRKLMENDIRTTGLNILLCEEEAYYVTEIEGLKLKIGGTIDRVDTIEEDGMMVRRIVDYKTGKYNEAKMKAGSLQQLFDPGVANMEYMRQTLIYCLAACSDPEFSELIPRDMPFFPVLIFSTKRLSDFDPHITIGGSTVRDFYAIKDDFEKLLRELVQTILTTTEFPMTANDQTCSLCKYRLLCGRKDKRRD